MALVLSDPNRLMDVLRTARVVAVLGAHHDPSRPAFYVPDYLARQGYTIHPVNPILAGSTLWGRRVVATLPEVPVPVDLVDVFRRSDALAGHVDEILAMSPRPGVVWLQSGIRDDAFARRMTDAGIDVVQDRCTYADHRAWRIGPVPSPV
jgi:predicted CoA-binding protein